MVGWSMNRLMGSIELSGQGETTVVLRVNYFLQDFTQTNQSELTLEFWSLSEFARVSMTGPTEEEVLLKVRDGWEAFSRFHRKAAVSWAVTLAGSGRTLNTEWKQYLEELIPGWVPLGPLHFSQG